MYDLYNIRYFDTFYYVHIINNNEGSGYRLYLAK